MPLCNLKSTEKSNTGILHHQTIHKNINLHWTIAIIVSQCWQVRISCKIHHAILLELE